MKRFVLLFLLLFVFSFFFLKIVRAADSCSLHSIGDANCDGIINMTDFVIWRCEFLNHGECHTQDQLTQMASNFNNKSDNKVDLVDFEIWRNHKDPQEQNPSPYTQPSPTQPPTDTNGGGGSHPGNQIKGSIVYTSLGFHLKFDIYIINADGTSQALTEDEGNNVAPALSEDGKKIVYVSDAQGNPDIYTMDARGENKKRILATRDHEDNPSFSPDGSKIVFTSDKDHRQREIYIMSANGSDVKKLGNNNKNGFDPSFSPDGRYIVFTSKFKGQSEIYRMRADGSDIQRLTNNSIDDQTPTFSPDGKKIVFSSSPAIFNERLNIMDADGKNQKVLTNKDNMYSFLPAFSPDGKRIAFTSISGINVDVYTMDLNGDNIKRQTEEMTIDIVGSTSAWK